MSYERDRIARLSPYVPGEQPADGDIVKLNTNENPYPPSAAVMEAIGAVQAEQLRRYPPPQAKPFRDIAAKTHGLDPAQVIATNGGDELLRLAITVYCDAAPGTPESPGGGGGGIGVTEPTYSLYPVLAAIQGAPVTRVPLDDDWSLPDDFAARMISAGAKLVLVVNPHAPSGRLEAVDRLRDIAGELRGKAVLLIDEAYVDFAERDALSLVGESDLDNVILLRTLSKGYSLAGLRFGYGLAHADRIAALDKARDSYNTDALAQAAAVAALASRDQAAASWQLVRDERERVARQLRDMGWQVPDSQSNFLLASPNPGQDAVAASVFNSLKQRGIFVRYFDQDRLRDKLRITVGTPGQNDALLEAVSNL